MSLYANDTSSGRRSKKKTLSEIEVRNAFVLIDNQCSLNGVLCGSVYILG